MRSRTKKILAATLAVGLVAGGYLVFAARDNLALTPAGTAVAPLAPATAAPSVSLPVAASTATAVTALSATPLPASTPANATATSSWPDLGQVVNDLLAQKWAGTQRITVLVMGVEHRQGDTTKAFQSDTMMLISVDPVAKTIVMLSIPRDLWVEIPGSGSYKIDEANFIGDAYHARGGGPGLAVRTVEQNFKINIDYYFRLDFTAFETFIDAIGGIDIVNPAAISDPTYPDGSLGYEPFYLSAGPHHLNGHDALRYARTRHGSTDIVRAQHQQQVIMAVRDKVLNLNLLPKLVAQAPLLYSQLNQSIATDLTLQQMIQLAVLGQSVPQNQIQSVVIDYNYVENGVEPGPAGQPSQDVLIPNWDRINELLNRVMPQTPQVGSRSTVLSRP